MTAIACVDSKNGIGKSGKLLISIKEDMDFFRETTTNNIIIMGRKTLFSFKDKMPLKNRVNIVFSGNDNLKNEYKNVSDIYFVKTIAELNELITKFPDKKTYVIGGETIYKLLINYCDTCLLTRLDCRFDADTFFPDTEKNGFYLSSATEWKRYNNINYRYEVYKKAQY